ncbi:hypothetical protein [Flavobacterium okayamense]|uniref:Calx-beta domain-containing protein n=1 Tax=Flavobacterium okayamense TaxID=2830782 RepID=A0ABM7S4K6_9FLAO|nr:hypothetical protein [Flavobacterium okayamense]BCY28429.1 hypothetical protein KK2020170_12970 [Flavobacterium okayamense]
MKKIKLLNFAFFALLGALVSCNDDEDATTQRTVKPVITAGIVDFTLTEGETVTINLTTDKAYQEDMDMKLELVGGTGSFRDYVSSGDETIIDDGYGVIGHKITFPAYTTSMSFDISALIDLYAEGTEVFEFRLYSMGNSNGVVSPASEMITLTVNDFVSDNVGIQLEWGQTTADAFGTLHDGEYLGVDDEMHPFTDWDFDFWIENSSGAVVDGFAAATGNHPEMSMLSASAPDDDYYVYVDLWSAGEDPVERFDHDLKINIGKYGTWFTTVNIPTSSDDVFSDYVIGITKSGTTYTVFDAYDPGTIFASGRSVKRTRIEKNKFL